MLLDAVNAYDSDEVLILSGKFADKFTVNFFSQLRDQFEEQVRNAVADGVEEVMREWRGDADVPLPEALVERMLDAGYAVANGRLAALLFEDSAENKLDSSEKIA